MGVFGFLINVFHSPDADADGITTGVGAMVVSGKKKKNTYQIKDITFNCNWQEQFDNQSKFNNWCKGVNQTLCSNGNWWEATNEEELIERITRLIKYPVDSIVVEKIKKWYPPRKCSICGLEGHNKRTCKLPLLMYLYDTLKDPNLVMEIWDRVV